MKISMAKQTLWSVRVYLLDHHRQWVKRNYLITDGPRYIGINRGAYILEAMALNERFLPYRRYPVSIYAEVDVDDCPFFELESLIYWAQWTDNYPVSSVVPFDIPLDNLLKQTPT